MLMLLITYLMEKFHISYLYSEFFVDGKFSLLSDE